MNLPLINLLKVSRLSETRIISVHVCVANPYIRYSIYACTNLKQSFQIWAFYKLSLSVMELRKLNIDIDKRTVGVALLVSNNYKGLNSGVT